MKLYTCSNCRNPLYFENNTCLSCGHTVGFDAGALTLLTLKTINEKEFADIVRPEAIYRFCENAQHGVCNWLVPAQQTDPFCRACALNRTIPTLTPENLARWKRIEIAKHRLVYSLLNLQLPFHGKEENDDSGIAFDFLSDISPNEKVMTGHDNGVITLNIEEADEALRVRHKLDLGERYRTLLGHFRHEIGHYYWDVLIQPTPLLKKFRQLFGDEQHDYSEALKLYYENGAPANWMDNFISPYAAAHPWEDWAETWAHYFHLMDTVETAYAFGIGIKPVAQNSLQKIKTSINRDPYTVKDFTVVFNMWIPLTFAINSLNRSMGHDDFYPFVISPAVMAKLQFIHGVCAVTRLKKPVKVV